MNPTTRQEILRRLSRLGELAPDLRFGQLIANLAVMAEGPWTETLWDLEDDALLSAIQRFETDLTSRNSQVA